MSESNKKPNHDEKTDWECPQCTYANSHRDRYCSACIYDRGSLRKPRTQNRTTHTAVKEEEVSKSGEKTNNNSETSSRRRTSFEPSGASQPKHETKTSKIPSSIANGALEKNEIKEESKSHHNHAIDPSSLPVGHPWPCPSCTFMNEYKDRYCIVCAYYFRRIHKSKRGKSKDSDSEGEEDDGSDHSEVRKKEVDKKQVEKEKAVDKSASKRKGGDLVENNKSSLKRKDDGDISSQSEEKISRRSDRSSDKHHTSLLKSPSTDLAPQVYRNIPYEDWNCPSCTLLNEGRNRYCSACSYVVLTRKKIQLPVSTPVSMATPKSLDKDEPVRRPGRPAKEDKHKTVAEKAAIPSSSSRRSPRTPSKKSMKDDENTEEDNELRSESEESVEVAKTRRTSKKAPVAAEELLVRETRSKIREHIEDSMVKQSMEKKSEKKVNKDREKEKEKSVKVKSESKKPNKSKMDSDEEYTDIKPSSSSRARQPSSTSNGKVKSSTMASPPVKQEESKHRRGKTTKPGNFQDRQFPSFASYPADDANIGPPAVMASPFNPLLSNFKTGLSRSISSDSNMPSFQNNSLFSSAFPFASSDGNLDNANANGLWPDGASGQLNMNHGYSWNSFFPTALQSQPAVNSLLNSFLVPPSAPLGTLGYPPLLSSSNTQSQELQGSSSVRNSSLTSMNPCLSNSLPGGSSANGPLMPPNITSEAAAFLRLWHAWSLTQQPAAELSNNQKDSSNQQVRYSSRIDDDDTEDNVCASDLTTSSTTDGGVHYLTNVDSQFKDFKPKIGDHHQVDLTVLQSKSEFTGSSTNWNQDNDLYDVIWMPSDSHLEELADEIPLSILMMEEIAPKGRRTRSKYTNYNFPEPPVSSKVEAKEKIETLREYYDRFPSKPVLALHTLYKNEYQYEAADQRMRNLQDSSQIEPFSLAMKRIPFRWNMGGALDMDLLVLNKDEREKFRFALMKYGDDDWNSVEKCLNHKYTVAQLQDYFHCIWSKKFKFECVEAQTHYRTYLKNLEKGSK